MAYPGNVLLLPGFPTLECGTVDLTLSFLVPNSTSDECKAIQSLGSLCGCPIRNDPCILCSSYGAVASFPKNELPFFSDMFLGNVPTCEIFDAYLKSQSVTDPVCFTAQSFIGDYCGCNVLSGDEVTIESSPCSLCGNGGSVDRIHDDKSIAIPDFPFKNCTQLESAMELLLPEDSETCHMLSQAFGNYCGCDNDNENRCSLCRDGSNIPWPNQPIGLLKDFFGGLVPTCDIFESFVASYDDGSEKCSEMQIFGSYCGCPSIDNHCELCPGESLKEQYKTTTFYEMKAYIGVTGTCGDVVNYLVKQVPADSELCHSGQSVNHLCGCNNGIYAYLDANTITKQAVLAWVPRFSALLSIMGATSIIMDILSKKKYKTSPYSQIMLAMSIFDISGCIAWSLSTSAIPKVYSNGVPTFIYGAAGNNISCKIQGFLFQLNFTSIFYNISLSIYYLLVIVYQWRTTKLNRNLWWLHGIPMILGIGLAFGGLPFYQNNIFGCHIQSHPAREGSWHPLIWFTFVPIFGTIFLTSALLLRVYFAVSRQRQRASKWQFRKDRSFRPNADVQSKKRKSFLSMALPSMCISSSHRQSQSTASNVSIEVQSTCQDNRRRKVLTSIERLEREVFIQSIFYVVALYICWTFILAAHLESGPMTPEIEGLDRYPFYLICFMAAPLQGFWNCLVYFRSRLLNRWRVLKEMKAKKQQEGQLSIFSFFFSFAFKKQEPIQTNRKNEVADPSDQIAGFTSSKPGDAYLTDEPEIAAESHIAIQEELAELEELEIRSFHESEIDLVNNEHSLKENDIAFESR